MGVLDDVDEREIRNDMRIGQRPIGERDKNKLRHSRRPRDPHQRAIAEPRAGEGDDGLRQRQDEGENQSEVAGFDDHGALLSCVI